jgi:shikimate kinase
VRGPLFLTGMMGSGKSTVGRLLAHELGATFVDLDVRIERVFGRPIPALLSGADEGAARFRELERHALESLVAEPGFSCRAVVVATGGGAVLDAHNRSVMRSHGTIVHLEVAVDVLERRLRADHEEDPSARPLLPPAVVDLRQRLQELCIARQGAYRDCDLVVDGGTSPAEVVARVRAALGDHDDAPEHEAV